MLSLLFAIISSALVSIILRFSENYCKNNISLLACNYVMCIALSCVFSGWALFPAGEGSETVVCLGVFNGILYLAGFLLLEMNIRRNGVVLSSTFMKLSVLVPTFLSVVFFHERPTALQILGFAAAVSAILLINMDKEKSSLQFKTGLILLLVTGGLGDAMSKVFEEVGNPDFQSQFLLYTFASAFILCVIVAFYKKQGLTVADLCAGLILGIPNFFSARFLLKALNSVPAVVAYPTYSVATIVVVTAAGICFFHEALNRRQTAAITIILAALVLLNI